MTVASESTFGWPREDIPLSTYRRIAVKRFRAVLATVTVYRMP